MLAPTTTLADALAVRSASPNSDSRFEYGWVRGSGSAAFIAGSLISGQVLNVFPPVLALVAQAFILACAAGTALLVPEIARAKQEIVTTTATLPGLPALFSNRPFRWLVIVAAIILGSHAMHDSFAMIAWNASGITPGVGSALWSEQVAAEVIIFVLAGPWLLRKIAPVSAMAISAGAATLRWTVMAQSSNVLAVSWNLCMASHSHFCTWRACAFWCA